MPKTDRLALLINLLLLPGYGAGLISLAQLTHSDCVLRGASFAVLASGVGAIGLFGLVATGLILFRQHTASSPSTILGSKVNSLSDLLSDTHRQLQSSEERFRTSIETMLDCFGIYRAIRDEQGQILDFQVQFVNQAACLNNQISAEEQLGKGLCELLPAHRTSGLFDEYCQVVETGQPLVKNALSYEDKFGQRRLIRAFDIRAAKLGDGFVVTWRDVTEQHQVEDKLRSSEARLRSILENMPVMLDAFDVTGNIIAWNQECERVTGYAAQEVIGNFGMMGQLYPNTHYCQQQTAQWNHQGDYYRNWEWDLTCKDGSVRTIAWSNISAEFPVPGWATWGIGVDVTERKQTERALAQANERFRLAMAAVNSAVYDWDIEQNQVDRSEGTSHLFGFPPEAIAANSEWWFNRIHPEDLEAMRQALLTALHQDDRYSLEYRVRNQQGEYVDVHDQGLILRDAMGRAVRVVGSTTDISERKRAEAALKQSEERLQLALNGARQGIWDWDLHTQQLTWDDRCKELFGLPSDFPVTYEWHINALHPDDRQRVMAAATQALQNGSEFEEEYRTVWLDGTIHWVLARGQGYATADGTPYRMSGTVLDITEVKQDETIRQQTEAALQESELMFRTLADTMPQLFWVVRSDTYHEYCNQRWCEYTGLSLEQVQREGVEQIIHPDDFVHTVQSFEEAATARRMFRIEHRVRRASDGEYRWLLSQALPLYDEKGQMVKWFGSSTDIHDQKLLIEERAQALDRERAARTELERASRMKDEFLAVVSHELRSPLNAILGWSRLLRTRTFNPEKTEQALASIERNAQAQTQLIEDLLDISRIIRGKIRLDLRPTQLIPCVQAAIDTIRPAATAKSIALSFHSTLDTDLVSGDPERLQQVVWNLLSNAVKFTPIAGQIEVRVQATDSMAQIQVTDSGKGISADFLPYIFERFRQEDATTTRTQGGLGLGLAIVRNLIELHGGTIHVDSAGEGQGTTFTVHLPLLPSALPNQPVSLQGLSRQTTTDTVLDLSNIQVLLVDDERDTREFLQAALEQYGARVISADSASEAWQFLQTHQPDILLSDVGMPDEDGFALIRRIRSLPPGQGGQIPAAALTAYAREGDRLEALSAGFHLHLPKPIEPIQLLTVIVKLLETQKELSSQE